MNTETKLSEVIHFYLGCDFLVEEIVDIPEQYKHAFAKPGDTLKVGGILLSNLRYIKGKPILRKLSDMKEEEEKNKEYTWNISPTGLTYPPKTFKYLLSKGFDLFRLIENNLAIDKQKM